MESNEFAGSGEKDRYPCGSCGRNFFPEALAKHEKICKNHQRKSQKRKVFNSGKQRDIGSNVPLKSTSKPGQSQVQAVKITNWRQNHLDFVNAIRSARTVQKAIKTGGPLPPPPPPSINPDYVPCPYCGRRFNAKAGARHIPFCQQRTKTHGAPVKDLSKRAAADVGGSKTGRGKAYYQKTIRGEESDRINSDDYGVSLYSSAFREGRGNSSNDGGLGATSAPATTYRPTTSPRRRIVASSASSARVTPPTQSGDRPVTGGLRKHPRNRKPMSNVRFSDKIQTFPTSPGESPRESGNIAVVPPFKARGDPGPPSNDSRNRTITGRSRPIPPTAQKSASPAGISRSQIRKDRIEGSRQISEQARTTPIHFNNPAPAQTNNNSSSLNSSGYGSDLSPRSPRVQSFGDLGGQGSPQYTRECSFVKRPNSTMASFCHDCGTQYPTPTSKFCCNCGMQRAFITPR